MVPLRAAFCLAFAFAARAADLRFETASVKPCRVDAGPEGARLGNAPRVSPGRLVITCIAVRQLIQEAYLAYPDGRFDGLGMERPIEGAPGWTQFERYTIEATSNAPAPEGMMKGPMLQALLEERFRLKVRRETRPAPVFDLVVTKTGPKLRKFLLIR